MTGCQLDFVWLLLLLNQAHGPGPYKWSMDPVQKGGPWTRGPCFVLTRLDRGS